MSRFRYRVTFDVPTNEDWVDTFELHDANGAWDISGATFAMKVRSTPEVDPVLELTTSNGRIAIVAAASGAFKIDVPASVVGSIAPGPYVHDLVMDLDGRKYRVMHGDVHVIKGIT